jgi:prenylcysteine oxidase / farnesylcysteine lyase
METDRVPVCVPVCVPICAHMVAHVWERVHRLLHGVFTSRFCVSRKKMIQPFAGLLLLLQAAAAVSATKIAVVGSGIGGAAATYYLQELRRNRSLPPLDITVFESRDYIGGRLKHITFGENQVKVELGGAAWTRSNQYVKGLAEKMNATVASKAASPPLWEKIAVWRGDGFAYVEKMIAENLSSVLKVIDSEGSFLKDTAESYKQQQQNDPFKDMYSFLKWGQLDKYVNRSIYEYFTALGVQDAVIEDGLVPIMRAIYNQNSNSSSFGMFGSLTALINHEDWPTGNSDLVKALFKAANASVRLSSSVININFKQTADTSTTQDSYDVLFTTKPTEGGVNRTTTEAYDAVLIAAPLETTGIAFSGMILPPGATLDRHFYPWFVTVVEAARINASQFLPYYVNSEGKELPKVFLTSANGSSSNPKTPWTVIQPLGKHGKGKGEPKNVWLVYSDYDLRGKEPNTLIDGLFEEVKTIYVQHWPYTFAHLKPLEGTAGEMQPIILRPGLYNLNAIESIASAMEVSCIAARNVARLTVDYLSNRKRI